MAGAFYPPPPTFIGGAQPYAPRLGIAQSGPAPQPPPIRGPLVAATFALLIASWTPGPQPAQGSPKFVNPVVSPPPVKTVSILSAIRSTWEPPFVLPQEGADIAPLLPVSAAASQPTPVSAAIAYAIRSTWEPAPPLPPQGAKIAPILPVISLPRPISLAWLFAIRSSWDAAPQSSQGEGDIAPLIPAPLVSQQIPVSLAQAPWIIDSWIDRTVTVITTTAIAASSSTPAVPPNAAPYLTIRASWDALPTDASYQGAGDIAPLIAAPAITAQGAVNWIPYQTIRQAWEVAFVLPPIAVTVATDPVASAPPIISGAQCASLIALNQPPWYPIPKAGTIASWLPPTGAPSQPQSISYATLFALMRAWDPPVWWPLPSLRLMPQSGPVPQAPPPSSYVNLNLALSAWPPLWWPGSRAPASVQLTGAIIGSAYWFISSPPRAFKIAAPARSFKVVSNMPQVRFDAMDPSETVRLTFDLTAQLAMLPIANVTLQSILSVTIANVVGGDTSLTQNGSAGLNTAATQAVVPVKGGVNLNDYSIRVLAQTTDPLTVLELTGVLPVRS